MSGNQKQSATGGPQTQRYSASSYQPILPQPPNSFAGSDAFSVTTPAGAYVQTQGPNQGSGLRGLPPGPPNQSSTPPNTDLKVQGLSGQIQPLQFVSNTVRSSAPYYPPQRPAGGPPNQASRMPAQQHRVNPQAQVYQSTNPYLVPGMYLSTASVFYPPRPPIITQPYTTSVFQHTIPYNSFSQQSSGGGPYHVYYGQHPTQAMMQRPTVTPTASAPNSAPGGNIPTQLMPPPSQTHNSFSRTNQRIRRPKALSIIDPNTGEDKLNEIFEEHNSHPASAESSARQTPQPAPPNNSKEVQAIFAKQVAQAISGDAKPEALEEPHFNESPLTEHYQVPVQNVQSMENIEYDGLPSNLQYMPKEFICSSKKEVTPIVSANSGPEVVLPKKDRESPIKGRKQSPRDHKSETPKDIPLPDSDKIPSVVKEENIVVPQTTLVSTPILLSETVLSTVKDITKDNVEKKGKKLSSGDADPLPSQQQPAEVPLPNSGKSKTHRNKQQNTHQNAKPQQQLAHQQQQQAHQQQQQAHQQQQQSYQQQPQAYLPQPAPQANQQQQQPPPPVPAPQPPKSNNKSNKSKELNMKGASKEGTDMDAFNDNAPKNEINANVLPPSSKSSNRADAVNANANLVAQPVVPSNVETEILVSSISENKKIDSNENIATIKSEAVTMDNNTAPISVSAPVISKPVSKPFDVTSIVKDPPKTTKPPFPINDNHEDSDKSSYSNDKSGSTKTEVNSKVSLENTLNSIKSQLPYKPGQWAPDNPTGLKIYERDFLLALKHFPASRLKPDNILETVLIDDRNRISQDSRVAMGGRNDYTNPPFPAYGGKSGSQRGGGRNSQTKMGSRSGDKNSNKPQPKVSISLRGDVKLHEAENAWKPNRLRRSNSTSEEDKKTEVLYKKVRSVLNKLTPQKFHVLVNQFRQFQIDTKDRLQGVINLVFEKAIDEPNFSVAYAMMCKELQIMAVPVGTSVDDKKNVAFRTLLVTRCQTEFEKQSVDESERNVKLREIEECLDSEKKKELTFELGEYDRRLRMKSVGTIRFIGELFKQHMLTATIMKRCLQTLLENKDEESLECLCKLLTTVGKELEIKEIDLSGIFEEMRKIAEGKRLRVSSRIKFMLQDVIDLKESKWVPRRGDLNPKTIDQIQKEAENEQLNIVMNTPRKEERSNGSRGGGGGGGGPRQKTNEEGWSSVSSARNRGTFNIQTDKMRVKMMPIEGPLGSSQMFGTWGKGASGSKNSQSTIGANIYTALDSIDNDKRPSSSRGKEPYGSKGPSLERNSYKSYDGRGSRSGSQHRDTSVRSIMSSVPPNMPPTVPQQPAKSLQQPVAQSVPSEISEAQLIRYIDNSLDEFLGDCCTFETFYQDLSSTIPPTGYKTLVYESFNHVLEKSQLARLKIGSLFAFLIKAGNLSFETFCSGLDEFLCYSDDLVIDIPQIWQYIAEQLVRLFTEEALPLKTLHKLLDKLGKDSTKKIMKSLFAQIVSQKGPSFLQLIWQKSDFQLSDFMAENEVTAFISENDLQFLSGGASPVGQNFLSYEEIHLRLRHFFAKEAPFDDIVNWISANVGERVTENQFIRVLATAIFESSIQNSKLVPAILSGHSKLIQKYIDNNTDYELQCLYSLQALIHKLEHPQGLLLSICHQLYEESTFCQESYIAWEASQDPAEQGGKGVAFKQLTSFFTQLKENEEDDYSSNSEDA